MPTASTTAFHILRIPARSFFLSFLGKRLSPDNPAALLITLSSTTKRVLTPSSPHSFLVSPNSSNSSSTTNAYHQGYAYSTSASNSLSSLAGTSSNSSSSSATTTTSSSPASLSSETAVTMAPSNAESKPGNITSWVQPGDKSGEFKRQESKFRQCISKEDGARFPPEKGRYHLYVSYACPWAHRTLIARKLKGLEDIISFSVVHWHLGEGGWRFPEPDEKLPGENVVPDPVHPDFHHLSQIYYESDPDYKDRFTVPVLYDKKTKTVVSNESSEIIRMFYYSFDDLLPDQYRKVDLYPPPLRTAIDDSNAWIYDTVNNGVYKSGFATTQEAYERNVTTLFASLDRIEEHLKAQPLYFFGDHVTEADIRLYTTIVRFDVVYVQHFKCNLRDVRSGYPAIHRWLRELYWKVPAFRETTDFEHIKKHYTKSHTQINPHSITPVGPVPDILPLDEEVAAVRHRA